MHYSLVILLCRTNANAEDYKENLSFHMHTQEANHQVEAHSFFPEYSSQISLPIYVVLVSERFHPELFQSVFDLFKKFNKKQP